MNEPMERGALFRRIREEKMTMFGLVLIGVLVTLAIAAPFVSRYSYDRQVLEDKVSPPSSTYWMGTDRFGRDVFARVMYGARVSLFVGFVSQGIAVLIGLPLGALGGYFRGRTDDAVVWLISVFWSFPPFLLIMAVSLSLPEHVPGIVRVFMAVGIVSWVSVARIVRGQFISEKENEYVEAARALGYSPLRIIFRHILPNTFPPLLVVVTLGFAGAILAEAGLSFLGLGVQPPTPSWGQMIRDGYGYVVIGTGWWMSVFPGLAIMLAVLAFNFVGDGLRDMLDPRLRGGR
ncbi:MAG TPA: ABC transporter permease [bacterium]|nr:ABC transporter permease [bacterium]